MKLLGAVEGRVEFNENEREHLKDCEECSRVFAAFENHFAEGTGGSAKSGTSGRGSEIEYGRLRRFKEGDRVFLGSILTCGVCAQCTDGYQNLCEHHLLYGYDPFPGAYAELAPVPPIAIWPPLTTH